MKGLIIDLDVALSVNNSCYIINISYIFYDFSKCKLLLLQTHDINLYHEAHRVFYNNGNTEEKYLIKNNKITKIITIINYYIRLSDIVIVHDLNFVKRVLTKEAERNNIKLELFNKETYCILEIHNKIFQSYDNIYNTRLEMLYKIYIKLFSLSYLYNNTSTILNCILIIRIYYKFKSGKDIEKFDNNIKRLRIYNS